MLFNHRGDTKGPCLEPFLKAVGHKEIYERFVWPMPNAKAVKETDFWSWRASQGFRAEAWCDQIKVGDEWANLLVYWLDHGHLIDGGFAVLVFRQYQKERVEYFEWRACAHEFVEKNIGHCLHQYTCKHCKKSYDVDSSG